MQRWIALNKSASLSRVWKKDRRRARDVRGVIIVSRRPGSRRSTSPRLRWSRCGEAQSGHWSLRHDSASAASVAGKNTAVVPACARPGNDFRRSLGGIPGSAVAEARSPPGECLVSGPVDQLLKRSELWRFATEDVLDVDVGVYCCS